MVRRILTSDEKAIREAKITFMTFPLGSIGIFIMMIWARSMDLSSSEPDDVVLIIASAGIGIIFLICGIYCPRWFKKRQEKGLRLALAILHLRWFFFAFIVFCGLFLGMNGLRWVITIPFFVIGIGTILFNFPTEERCKRILENIG